MVRKFLLAAAAALALCAPAKAQSGLASPNTFWAGPAAGSSQAFATWRALVGADFPAGVIPTSALVDQSTTVNGTLCKLGSTCTVTATVGGVTIGTTTITGGTTTRPLYDNAGVLGEYTATQMTAFLNLATAANAGLVPAWPNNTTTFFRGDGSYATLNFAALGGSASCAQLPALTGDITSTACATTLATVNSNIGSWGSGTFIPNFTVNAKGLLTAAGQTAVTYAANNLTGSTLAAGVTASSLTSVGTLIGGAASTGFTVQASNATWTGTVPAANLPKATTSTFGVVEPDNSTIMISAGVISAPGSGGGTVSSCAQYSLGSWLGAGTTTTLNCLAPAASAILVTSASDVPSLATALPTNFGINAGNITWSGTIPGANMQAVNLASSGNGGVTGNLSVANLNSGTAATAGTFWGGAGAWTTAIAAVHIQTFCSSGCTHTAGPYTPTTGIVYAVIECWGGGGGGGGAGGTSSTQTAGGAAGGAGSRSVKVSSAAAIGASQTITLGAAGSAATGSGNGGNGGDTSVGSLCVGKGGTGAIGFSPGAQPSGGGAGGVAGTGDVVATGMPGGSGWSVSIGGASAIFAVSGTGGSSTMGGGGSSISAANATSISGNAGAGYGSGGGGGVSQSGGGAANGGAGTTGYVKITEYTNQ